MNFSHLAGALVLLVTLVFMGLVPQKESKLIDPNNK